MTDLDLDAIEKACAEATPERWLYTEQHKDFVTGHVQSLVVRDGPIAKVLHEPDARFIASARQWVPELVAEVRRLREENRRFADAIVEAQWAEGRGHVEENGCPWCRAGDSEPEDTTHTSACVVTAAIRARGEGT